jgi:hypothetical protein
MSLLITPPKTVITNEITELLRQQDPVVSDHCERTYQFAAGFAKLDGVEIDDEVLYLGTVLHDLGLCAGGDETARFEIRGANRVRDLLFEHGMERDRVENVWDCIAMHATSSFARHKSVETRYSSRGISVDIRGVGAEALPSELIRAVLDRWPRQDFTTLFSEVLRNEVRAHPETTRWSWLESITIAEVPGFVPVNILDVIHASTQLR